MTYIAVFFAGVAVGMLAVLLAPKRDRVERVSALLRGKQEPPKS